MTFTFDFVRVKSYDGDQSTGNGILYFDDHYLIVRVDGINLESLKGRNVIIVEDIIDTGNTMQALVPMLENCGAASVVVQYVVYFFILDLRIVREGYSS